MSRRLIAALVGASALVLLVIASMASAASGQGALPQLSLAFTASSINASGSMQSGGVNVVTTNGGAKEGEVILFLLKPGVSLQEVEAFLGSKQAQDPNAAGRYGSLVFSAETIPAKGSSEAQTSLVPGQYVALAGFGHGAPRLHTTFTVTAAANPVALPKPEATIRSIEFDFRGPSTIRKGELVRFENQGYLVHMDLAFPVASKQAAKEVAAGFKTGKSKGLKKLLTGPPVAFQGVVSHGAYQQETITAKPGWYVQVCFMETQDHRPHTLLGMERPLRITK